MTSRRKFLQQSSALALGGLAISNSGSALSFLSKTEARPAGLQLFTVMSKIDADLDGTLKRIADIGYKNIESAFSMKGGFYGLSGKEFAAKLKGLGMSWKAHHTIGAPFKMPAGAKMPTGSDGKPLVIPPMKNLRDSGQEIVDAAAEGGVEYLVCASTPLDTLDEVNKSLETLQKAAEMCKKAGIGFAYHNHTKEFENVEGKVPFELMRTQISADLLKFELDLAWATKAGADPVELFKKNPGRFPLWHVKDLNKETQKPVEVGTGYIDFKRIFAEAKISGMKYFFVEQDGAPDPLVNIETSFKNLQKIEG